ncbi:hypothetical protein BX666DRAFT_2022772 [Dichotomocladium elegans]|nr:hypothetical protein BX666DRAFT_2022772 [Dichotomocladium elegans]
MSERACTLSVTEETESVPTSNLKRKIIHLSTKLGESSSIDKTADMPEEEKEALKQQLHEARQEKLRSKMFHAIKALKSNLKKSKALEIQKQVRKVNDARTTLQNAKPSDDAIEPENGDESQTEKKKGKSVSPEDVARYEKELEILKLIHVDTLAEKTLRNKVLKHSELKQHTIVTEVLPAAPESNTNHEEMSTDEKVMISTIESRVLGHKPAQATISKLLDEILNVIRPPPKTQSTLDGNTKKRVSQDHSSKRHAKHTGGEDHGLTASSAFVESLNVGEDRSRKKRHKANGDYYDDKEFDRIYNGKKKKNRMGQKARRQLNEQQYGRDAIHLQRKRDETRLLKKKAKGHHGKLGASGAAPPPRQSREDHRGGSGLLKPEEFHPSWQAKRQEQEMIAKALSGGGASANKKIVFDDSD